jgi:hypothetical protein
VPYCATADGSRSPLVSTVLQTFSYKGDVEGGSSSGAGAAAGLGAAAVLAALAAAFA